MHLNLCKGFYFVIKSRLQIYCTHKGQTMLTGNTNFYHGHIQSNIARLQQRKDKFIHNRLQFVKQYCVPIEMHIKQIYKEVNRYKIMKDTQEEVIENEPDIVTLKEEITNYMNTHHYFQEKLNQYEKKQIELDMYNRTIRERIQSMKRNIKNNREELGFHLPDISKSRTTTINSEKTTFPLFKSFIQPQNNKQFDQYSQNKSEASFDKRLIKLSSQMKRIQSHLITKQVKRQQDIILEDELNEHPQQTKQAKKRIFSLRQKITAFNKTQTLFRDCFDTKKRSIQKSVSQLQSKLIVHRAQFLNVCQAIGSKDKTVAFEQFNKLSCDEIVTLFISFVWLNQRLNSEFKQKRRDIMEHLIKLPKLS